jgi:hypothetical protein
MQFDDSAWPLVIATTPALLTHASIDAMERGYDGYFARGELFAVITDIRLVEVVPDALWRRHLGEWMERPDVRENHRRLTVASATVMSSPAVRAALTAIHWLWRPRTPQRYTSSMPEAVTWCAEALSAAGVAESQGLGALQASVARCAVPST